MASTYSAKLRTELPALGDQAGSWDQTNNRNIGTILEDGIAGTASHSTAGAVDTTLSALNGVSDEARMATIKLTGVLTGSHNVICPLVSKQYLVINNTTGAFTVTFKGVTGTGVVCPQGSYMHLYCDGTNVTNQLTNTTLIAPVLGAATGTSLAVSGQLTSTIATGTAPLVVASTTVVANLRAATAVSADSATTATTATTATNLSGGSVVATTISGSTISASGLITANVGVSTTTLSMSVASTLAATLAVTPTNTGTTALIGSSTGGVGVYGTSATNAAVYGNSGSAAGVYGLSNSGYGVVGSSLQSAGRVRFPFTGALGGDYTVPADSYTLLFTSFGTVTLPSAASYPGVIYRIVLSSPVNTFTVVSATANVRNYEAMLTATILPAPGAQLIQSTGGEWVFV